MIILETQVSKNLKDKIQLIQINDDEYCVRKITSGLFGDKRAFYCLNYNGTTLMHDRLANEVTIGSYKRCLTIYNANLLNLGIK